MSDINIYKLAESNKDYLVKMRRYFHQHPELSWKEIETTNAIAKELESMGIPYKKLEKTGLIATIKGKSDKPVIGLRADIDALPITEVKDLDYKSQNEGVMHACGHDSHITMLLGAAKMLCEIRDQLNCTIKLIFQPAEEIIEGAKSIVDNEEIRSCDNMMAIHIFPYLPVGTISVEAGPRFSSADTIKIKIKGKGGHGSTPSDAIDPIVTASAVISNLQTIASREIKATETCVVSICTFHCGTLSNIIFEEADLSGTVRTFSPEVRERLPEIIERIISNTCKTFRADYEFEYIYGTAPTINDEASSKRAEIAVKKILGDKGLVKHDRITMGEDFSWFLNNAPGYLALVGCRNEAEDKAYPLHHEKFDIDENAMVNGSALFVQYVLETMDNIFHMSPVQ